MTDGETPKGAAPMRDLGQRIASGVALAALVLAALWAGPLPFAIVVGAVGVVVVWEWGRVVRSAGVDAIMVIQAVAVPAGVLLAALGLAGLGLIVVLVAAIISALLAFGERGHMAAFGALYLDEILLGYRPVAPVFRLSRWSGCTVVMRRATLRCFSSCSPSGPRIQALTSLAG